MKKIKTKHWDITVVSNEDFLASVPGGCWNEDQLKNRGFFIVVDEENGESFYTAKFDLSRFEKREDILRECVKYVVNSLVHEYCGWNEDYENSRAHNSAAAIAEIVNR